MVEHRKSASSSAKLWGAPSASRRSWTSPAQQKAMVLLFETEATRSQSEVPSLWYGERYASQLWAKGLAHRIVGAKSAYRGWGTKWHAVKRALEDVPPDTTV